LFPTTSNTLFFFLCFSPPCWCFLLNWARPLGFVGGQLFPLYYSRKGKTVPTFGPYLSPTKNQKPPNKKGAPTPNKQKAFQEGPPHVNNGVALSSVSKFPKAKKGFFWGGNTGGGGGGGNPGHSPPPHMPFIFNIKEFFSPGFFGPQIYRGFQVGGNFGFFLPIAGLSKQGGGEWFAPKNLGGTQYKIRPWWESCFWQGGGGNIPPPQKNNAHIFCFWAPWGAIGGHRTVGGKTCISGSRGFVTGPRCGFGKSVLLPPKPSFFTVLFVWGGFHCSHVGEGEKKRGILSSFFPPPPKK